VISTNGLTKSISTGLAGPEAYYHEAWRLLLRSQCDSGRRTCFHFYYGGCSDIYISVHFGETLGGLGIAQA
jgi:hypothetical protein